MVKIILHNTLIICFLLISNVVVSQMYKDTATISSQYVFSQFTDGVVLLNDGTIFKGKFNYDTSTNQMKYVGTTNEIMYLSEPEKIYKVTIANRDFIYVKNFFVEIISDGPVSLCMRVHEKQYTEKNAAYGCTTASSSISSATGFGRKGIDYQLSSSDKVSFQLDSVFYVMNNGISRVVSKENDLLKCFPSNKALIKQELSKQHTEFSSIDSMKSMINWINVNGIKD